MLVVFEQNWLTDNVWPVREVGSASVQGAAFVSLNAGRIYSTNASVLGAATVSAQTRNLKNARANIIGRGLQNSPVPIVYRIVHGGFSVVGSATTDFDPKAVWAAGATLNGIGYGEVISTVLNIAYGSIKGCSSSYLNANIKYGAEAAILGAAYIVPMHTQLTLNAGASIVGRGQHFVANRVRRGASASITNNSSAAISKSTLRKRGTASVIGRGRSTPNMLAVVNGEATAAVIGRGRARLRPAWVYSMPEVTISGSANAAMDARVRKTAGANITASGHMYPNGYVRRGAKASVIAKAVVDLDPHSVISMSPTEIIGRAPSYNLRTIVRKTSGAAVTGKATATLLPYRKRHAAMAVIGTSTSGFQSIVRNIAKATLIGKAVASINTAVDKFAAGAAEAIAQTNLVSSVLRPAEMNISATSTISVGAYTLKIMEADLTGKGDIALATVVIHNATMDVVAVSVVTADASATYAAGAVATGEGNAELKARRYRKSIARGEVISVIKIGRKFKRN